jgi:ABC-type transport system involved in cytochrome bd biosynthesis fused ATPase/permease subunit
MNLKFETSWAKTAIEDLTNKGMILSEVKPTETGRMRQQEHRLFLGTLRENSLIERPDSGDEVLFQVI